MLLERDEIYPPITEKLCWGAFLVTPVWAFVHKKKAIAVLSLIPLIGFVISIQALFCGGRWAWESKVWNSVEEYKESRLRWTIGGVVFSFLLAVILYLL